MKLFKLTQEHQVESKFLGISFSANFILCIYIFMCFTFCITNSAIIHVFIETPPAYLGYLFPSHVPFQTDSPWIQIIPDKIETISRHFPDRSPLSWGIISKRRDPLHPGWSYFRIPDSHPAKSMFAKASRVHWHWHRRRSPDASHPRLPTPSACHPVVVDDATHLVAPRRRRRTVTFARDHHSRVEFSRRRRYKRIVTNLLFPFSLCAACQNGLDHRRRSGIPSRRSRLISLLKSVICNDSLNWETNVISVIKIYVMLETRWRQSYMHFSPTRCI